MSETRITTIDILIGLGRIAAFSVISYYTMKLIIDKLGPDNEKNKCAQMKARTLCKKLGIKEKLSDIEQRIASNLIVSYDLTTSWKDIGGMPYTISKIKETLIYPITHHINGNSSTLLQPPKGILLHGPPGCGKTMLAKAIAKESKANFINLDISDLTDKWYGESQKLVSGLFNLASKISPCIIFIDEIDSFLRSRSSSDHEATAMMKSIFLQRWEGLETDNSKCIIIMGATNRPSDVDKAILRRMPANFEVPLPDLSARKEILRLVLKESKAKVDFDFLAELSDGFSGSDIREICRRAAVSTLSDVYNENGHMKNDIRPINTADLVLSMDEFRHSSVQHNL